MEQYTTPNSSEEDKSIHLPLKALRSLLAINHLCVPAQQSLIWVTAQELRDRSVYCGIHNSLTVDDVKYAIKHANNGLMFLDSREYKRVQYYRSQLYQYDQSIPNDQRLSPGGRPIRLHFLPDDQYCFAKDNDASVYLHHINNALQVREEKYAKQDNRRKEKHSQQSKLKYKTWCLFIH
jgi:hypothetical protein